MPEAPAPRGDHEAVGSEGGRPPSLTEEAHRKIIDCVEILGMSDGRAARVAGVDPGSISHWKKRGRLAEKNWETMTPSEREREERYLKFFKALRDAEPMFEAANLLTVQQAAKTDWRAAMALLERRIPQLWGKRLRVSGEGQGGSVLVELARRLEAARARVRGKDLR